MRGHWTRKNAVWPAKARQTKFIGKPILRACGATRKAIAMRQCNSLEMQGSVRRKID